MGTFSKLQRKLMVEVNKLELVQANLKEIIKELDKVRSVFKNTPQEKIEKVEEDIKEIKSKWGRSYGY